MTIRSSASTQRWTNRERLDKEEDRRNNDFCRNGEQNDRFPGAHTSGSIMRPVHVDTASASAVAAKNIFMASELGGGVARDACVGFRVSSFGPSGFAPSDLAELGGATFRGGR